MKKIISVLLSLVLLLTMFSVSISAESEILETVIDDDGTVLTLFVDGTKKAVTPEGDICVKAPDGTETYYFVDGSMQIIAPGGTTTHTNADGTGVVLDAGGEVVTTWETHGSLVLMTDWDEGGELRKYFKGGSGAIERDENGDFYGSCTSPEGVVLEKASSDDGDVVTLSGPDNSFVTTLSTVLYDDGSEGARINIKQSDGSVMEFPDENGNIYMKFTDGSTVTADAKGYGEATSPDGSYQRKTAEGVEVYNAETGYYERRDTSGAIVELDAYDGDRHITVKDGVYEEENKETGDYRIARPDGSWEVGNTETDKIIICNEKGEIEYIGYGDDEIKQPSENDVFTHVKADPEYSSLSVMESTSVMLRVALYKAGKVSVNESGKFTMTLDTLDFSLSDTTVMTNLRLDGYFDAESMTFNGNISWDLRQVHVGGQEPHDGRQITMYSSEWNTHYTGVIKATSIDEETGYCKFWVVGDGGGSASGSYSGYYENKYKDEEGNEVVEIVNVSWTEQRSGGTDDLCSVIFYFE